LAVSRPEKRPLKPIRNGRKNMEFKDFSFLLGVFFCLGTALAFGALLGMAIFDALRFVMRGK
jgi:uncharacterized protein YggT (Ycf19 family)